jgi:C-terminal peptidase prc
MTIPLRYRLLIPIFLILLACQTVTGPLVERIRPTSTSSPTLPPPTPTSTFTATLEPTNTPTPTTTATPTATLTPLPTSTQTPSASTSTPLAQELQLQVFEELWQVVNEDYLYADFNGLDWDAIKVEYREKILTGLTNELFYAAMREMIFRLGDEHSSFLSPQEATSEDDKYQGNLNYVGVGVLIAPVPERNRAVILLTFPGSPAEEAGINMRDSILAADDVPILDENGFLRDIVRGPEGTEVTITVQTPGELPRDITITRRRITGGIPVPYTILTSPAGKRIGYMMLPTFGDITIVERVREAIISMNAENPLGGLIIDNSVNGGGADTVLRPILSYYTDGILGYFISRNEERPLQVEATDVAGSQEIPLVVLIGSDTASYGEVFSGVLKDIDRAYLIGENTGGNIETLWGYNFADGSRAWIAHESFRPRENPDQDWEATGIIPDEIIQANWDEYSLETDPTVLAALAYFDLQLK